MIHNFLKYKEIENYINEKGMNHDEAIKISMELDALLNDYQKKLSKQI